MRIALIEVGHGRNKPAIHGLTHVRFRRVGVQYGRQLIGSLQIPVVHLGPLTLLLAGLRLMKPLRRIEPVPCWHILYPWMFEAAVVENHIHNHFQSLPMGLINQLSIGFIATKAWIYLIIICRSIAMISTCIAFIGRVILEHRRKPQCRNAQFFKIIQALANAFKVAAVPQTGLCTVFLVGIEAFHLCRMVLSLRKTVGHEHVEYIGIGESHALIAGHLTLFERIFHLFAIELQRHLSGPGTLQVQVNQQVIGRIEPHERVDTCPRIVHRDMGIADILPVNH